MKYYLEEGWTKHPEPNKSDSLAEGSLQKEGTSFMSYL